MKPEQENKYEAFVNASLYPEPLIGRIRNRATGEVIPDDEPVFVFRARDKHAAKVLSFYLHLCADEKHQTAIGQRISDFRAFERAHPERMKEPDSPA